MAAEMDFPASFGISEGGLEMGSISISPANDNLETPESFSARNFGKPPLHPSSVLLTQLESEAAIVSSIRSPSGNCDFKPIFRSGCCSEIGPRLFMEDEYICIDDLTELSMGANISTTDLPLPRAFYGVFDGHGGSDAAVFTRENILKFIVEDSHFPACVSNAMTNAFLRADSAFANAADSVDTSSGTTALTAFIFGRTLVVANAGDCRAVLSKRGRAVELSKDHKPSCNSERLRIEKHGGVVYEGYLNGRLSVSRALGDWHMKKKGQGGASLSAVPELQDTVLTEEDEFLILGCDGLWDVMSSQHAVTLVRRELMLHNDPEICSKVLVSEALKLDACDNLTVIVVCFSSEPPPPRIIHQIHTRFSNNKSTVSAAQGLNLLPDLIVDQETEDGLNSTR
ncbi:hypothetical protein Dimus_002535 [Dionaea muscipula]